MSKGSDNHEIMTLNQQADAAALIKDIERTLKDEGLTWVARVALSAEWIRRYKEKWPCQQS